MIRISKIQYDNVPPEGRIFSTAAEAVSISATWKAAGDIVCMTNGCFDMFHPGHARFLVECRKQVPPTKGRLVVALNSDESVQRLKGVGRPIIPVMDRAYTLACLRDVDAVIIFTESTPERLIRNIRPHVLCKGEHDFVDGWVPGAGEVTQTGGRVVPIKMETPYSTTNLVAYIQELERLTNER